MKQETYETINLTPPKMIILTRIHQEPKKSKYKVKQIQSNLHRLQRQKKKKNSPLKTKL